ncbi:MAG: hypothetical protein HC862_15815, partial [Scytonema sp. RU_4_4]|nr:hypothetical protein [Scytonema sp. RU_4_4]
SFAYPHGNYSEETTALVWEAGIYECLHNFSWYCTAAVRSPEITSRSR